MHLTLWNHPRMKVDSRLRATSQSIVCRGRLYDRCGKRQIVYTICSLTSPMGPYCEACRRAKMKEKRNHAGSYLNTTVRWRQLVTGDHITSTKDHMIGIDGSNDMLVIKDAFSGFKAAYPMGDKSAESTMEAIRHFMGGRKIERLYSDRSGEIERALRELKIVPEQSQPGVPQNNAVAERLVQDVLDGTRTALVRVGLPLCFWEFARRHYCMAENFLPRRKSAEADGDRQSAWDNTHNSIFHGQLIPIGAKVILKPAETKQDGTSKMEPTSLTGIFAGYEMAPGCKWSGVCMVWTLAAFADINLLRWSCHQLMTWKALLCASYLLAIGG